MRFADYSLQKFQKDLLAGVVVGVIAIPLGMAFAIASGVKPEYGIYTTIIAGIIISFIRRFEVPNRRADWGVRSDFVRDRHHVRL